MIPPCYTHKLIALFHDKLYCHAGIFKTTNCLSQHFAWKGLNCDVIRFISNCETCLMSKSSINPEQKQRCVIRPPSRDHEVLVVDHLGPFTMAPCRARYVLTVICQLTGYAHAIAVKTTSAEETARALYDNVFSKHGLCRTLISDNASNFINEVYKCLASSTYV